MADSGSLPILEAVNVGRHYPDGQVRALQNVDLSIPRGQFLAITGPSGSGKSTLLYLLGAVDEPTSGEIRFEGCPLRSIPDKAALRAGKIGFIFQSFLLLPTLTALENVQLPMFEGKLCARERSNRAASLLASVGMGHRADHIPAALSVGERQRVAIARALANDPVLLLADEPTGNLDSARSREILDLLSALHRERRVTIVIAGHNAEIAARAERILDLRDGRIVHDSAA